MSRSGPRAERGRGEVIATLGVVAQASTWRAEDQSSGEQACAVGFVTLNEVAPVLAIWPPAAPPKATQYSAPPLTRRTTLAPVPGFGGTTRTSGCSPGPSLPWIFTLSRNVPLAVFESCASLTWPLSPLLST